MLGLQKFSPAGRSSFRARETLVAAFCQYFERGSHLVTNAPNLALVASRYRHNMCHKLSIEDSARTEIGQIAASISSTIPAAFWMLWHVLSDPLVLAECRREIEQSACFLPRQQPDLDNGEGLGGRRGIEFDRLTKSEFCPILVSTWHEVLRYNHTGIAARMVMEETMLGRYLLKKGSTVVIANPVIHSDTSAWGPSANEFQHQRFVRSQKINRDPTLDLRDTSSEKMTTTMTKSSVKNLEKSTACRIFGGGSTLCPGRYLASQEVLSLVALVVLNFDVFPVHGRWVLPGKNVSLTTALPTPYPLKPSDLDSEILRIQLA
ncbi:hypothetical protein HIM_06580 [Hirsutella minnesotensis 3608]|uniref:Cytochrome P450 n=1 Tax=Hirsutella minnesotensis 3608 TaxID=1043627 RepID=A0A0F7ZJ21_9HYPO|nr:hypothetical protein HIM_06580 [Hirsutella minnesotensis 3608]